MKTMPLRVVVSSPSPLLCTARLSLVGSALSPCQRRYRASALCRRGTQQKESGSSLSRAAATADSEVDQKADVAGTEEGSRQSVSATCGSSPETGGVRGGEQADGSAPTLASPQGGSFKHLVAKFGALALCIHMPMSALNFTAMYTLVSMGLPIEDLIGMSADDFVAQYVDLGNDVPLGSITMAVALHKCTSVPRYALTGLITPVAARRPWVRRTFRLDQRQAI